METIETSAYYFYALLADPPQQSALDAVTALPVLRRPIAVTVLSAVRPPVPQFYQTVWTF